MKIRIYLDRMESYALLVAQEYLRQMIAEEDGGIPLLHSIYSPTANREYATARFTFEFRGDGYTLDIRLEAGDRWPKQGIAHLIEQGLMEAETGVVRHDFELRGNPAEPRVEFIRIRGGG